MALFSFNQNKKRKRTATDIIMVVVERLCMQVNGFSFSMPWWMLRRGLVEWLRSESVAMWKVGHDP